MRSSHQYFSLKSCLDLLREQLAFVAVYSARLRWFLSAGFPLGGEGGGGGGVEGHPG